MCICRLLIEFIYRGVVTGGYIGIYTPQNQSTLQIFTSCFVHMWDINMF